MRGAVSSLPYYAFMFWCSIKAQTLYLYLIKDLFNREYYDDYYLCIAKGVEGSGRGIF
jgi:hypothetical protein